GRRVLRAADRESDHRGDPAAGRDRSTGRDDTGSDAASAEPCAGPADGGAGAQRVLPHRDDDERQRASFFKYALTIGARGSSSYVRPSPRKKANPSRGGDAKPGT